MLFRDRCEEPFGGGGDAAYDSVLWRDKDGLEDGKGDFEAEGGANCAGGGDCGNETGTLDGGRDWVSWYAGCD